MKKQIDPNNMFVPVCFECNNNCISCIMADNKSLINPKVSFNQILKSVDEIIKFSDSIGFNGGEPTLNENLFDIFKYIIEKNKDMEIILLSNARRFANKNYSSKLKKLGINNFILCTSLYGPNSKIHDAITRTPESFNQTIEGIKNLIGSKIKIQLRIIINKLNYKFLPEIAEYIINNFTKDDFVEIAFVSMKIIGRAFDKKTLVAYKISDIIPFVHNTIISLSNENFNVSLYHFPHCVLPRKLWRYSKGVTAEQTEIIFPEFCNNCIKKKNCTGIWKSYYDLYGGGEFKEIKYED